MSWDEALGTFDEMTAAADHVDMYWFPHTDRMLTKRNTRRGTDLSVARPLGRGRGWFDDEFLQNTAFGVLTAGANRAPRRDPADEPDERLAAQPAHLLRRPAPGLHRLAAGGLPRDGVRRPARGRARGAARVPTGAGRVRPADQLPGRDPGRARRRHPAVDRRRARTRSTWPSTPTATPSTATTSRCWSRSCAPTTADPTGARCTPGRPPTSSGVSALRGLPGDARPAGPAAGLRQRLPAPGAGRLRGRGRPAMSRQADPTAWRAVAVPLRRG